MALKYIDNEDMLQLSGTWVDPAEDAHKAILAIPDLAGFLPRVGTAHSSLAALLQPTESVQIAAISAEQAGIDIRHDGIIRGSHGLLTAMAELLAQDDAKILLSLRDFLLPEGLSSMQKSYRAEATQAMQLQARITSDIQTQLDSIHLTLLGKTKPLSAFVQEWISLAKKLGELEDAKARLLDNPDDSNAAATLKARNTWIRTVNAFLAIAELAELDEATDRLVFGPLRIADKAATRRDRAGRTQSAATSPATESAAPPVETP